MRSRFPLVSLVSLPVVLMAAAIAAPPALAQGAQVIYGDALENGWQNYGWAALNYSSTSPSPVHGGSDAVSVSAGAYQALYVHHADFDSTPYGALTFWINGGPSGGQTLQVQAELGGGSQSAYRLTALAANTWRQVTIPLATLGAAGKSNLDGFWIQNTSGGTLPTFYVDDISLQPGTATGPPLSNAATTVTVDAGAARHPISPLVYGVAYGSTASLLDLNSPLNRMGGNNTSRYNWQLNADNKANDYFFESIGDTDPTPGKRGDDFIAQSQAAGAQAMLTIPMVGWVAKLGPNRNKLSSFSIAKYGTQQSTDPYMPDAGNGVSTGGQNITGNDPNDADVPADSVFQTGWINHLVGRWGTAAGGGLSYYLLDNEPSIWHSTHRDVHPQGEPMQEELSDILAYGGAVKTADPSALTVAPEEWGWSGYFYSGADQQYGGAHGWSSLPDRAAHGGMDYLPWLLQQLQQNNAATGKRLLDVFSVHFYPQGGEFGNDTSTSMDLLRNRSTRQLWDPNYTSESWIGTQVQLIPRLKGWVAQYYPGTKTALTEYNWGAEGDINGATTQADIFGIFGREGLDLATRWTTPDPSTPTYKAMKLYRNYDGSKSGFGDISVSDAVADPDSLSSFAAVRGSDGALTVVVINKVLGGSTPVTIKLANFTAAGAAQEWQLTSANAITRLADVSVIGGALSVQVPSQSISLFVIPAASVAPAAPAVPTGLTATAGDTTVALSWAATPGATSYNISRGTTADGEATPPIATGLTTPSYIDTGLADGTTYFYTVRAVNAGGAGAPSSEAGATPIHQPPTVTQAASATPSPVTGTTTAISVLGGDTGGEATLTYTWAASGPAPVTFSPNGTHAAKNATATFTQAGSYTLTVTVKDGAGLTTTSRVAVTVSSTLTKIAVTPATATLTTGGTQQFTAAGADQFGAAFAAAPAWAAAGGGTITPGGLFTAGSATGGPYAVTAGQNGVTGTASVSVTAPALKAALQVNAGGPAVAPFSADRSYKGGTAYAGAAPVTTQGVAGAAPSAVYQTGRQGTFTYTLTGLPPGTAYTLRLHFAEVGGAEAGQRLFNVKVNGTQVLTNLDVFTAAGGANRALVESFPASASWAGAVTVQFVPVKGSATLSAIEILH